MKAGLGDNETMGRGDLKTPVMGELWTLEDLERLWKAKGKNEKARRKWVIRRVHDWGIPMHGKDPRFLPAVVLRETEKHLAR